MYSLATAASALTGALQRGHTHGRKLGRGALQNAELCHYGFVLLVHRAFLLSCLLFLITLWVENPP